MNKKWARPFFTVWSAQAISLFGSELVQFALIWWLTESTGSATVLATAALVGMLPRIVIGPFSGALIDRWNRRRVMIIADGTVALATLVLAIIYASGHLEPWHVYVAMFVRATGGGFHWPAMTASTSLMVPEAQLSRVAGMNQTLHGVASMVTPPLGALLLGVLPMHGILAVDVVTAIIAISPLLFVHIPQPERKDDAPVSATTILRDIREGLRYIAGWPTFLAIMITSALVNFVLTPTFTLVPILVTRHFGGQAFQLAWLDTAAGVGIIVGGLILSAWGGFKHRLHTMLLGLAGIGIGCLGVGAAPANAFLVAIAGTLVVGLFIPICDGPFLAMVQSLVEPSMQGRVLSLAGTMSRLAAPLSMAVAGPLADKWGVPLWFTTSGIVCIALAIWPLFVPRMLALEKGHPRNPARNPPIGARA